MVRSLKECYDEADLLAISEALFDQRVTLKEMPFPRGKVTVWERADIAVVAKTQGSEIGTEVVRS